MGRRLGQPGVGPKVRPARPEVWSGEGLLQILRCAGAHVMLLPPGDREGALSFLACVDGVILTGGAFDIHPRHYGQVVSHRVDEVDEDRTLMELALASAAASRGLPALGLCGGMQAMGVALGGTLFQHIPAQLPGALEHEQPTDPARPWHGLVADEPWQRLLGDAVNSTHHQAIDDPGALQVIGHAPDGVIEAVRLPGHPFYIGVQWHPEILSGGHRLLDAFVAHIQSGSWLI